MCAHYGLGLGILPVIAVLANVAIAKVFGIEISIILSIISISSQTANCPRNHNKIELDLIK